MSIKKITLTEDHIKLIKNIKFEAFEFSDSKKQRTHYGWGIDQYSLFGGTFAMEDIALILGKYDQYIKGTEEDPLGKAYPKELEDYWVKLFDDIYSNMEYIISLVLYYTDKGGLTPGTYKCKGEVREWTKVD